MADELLDLFANVPGIQDFVTPPAAPTIGADGLAVAPEHGGVTDEAVAQYFQSRMSTAPPQFRAGVGAPAPVGGLEDGGTGGTADPVPGRVDPPPPQTAPPAPQTSPPAPSPPAPEQTPPSPESSPSSPPVDGSVPPGAEPSTAEPPPVEYPEEIEWGNEKIARDRLNAWRAFQRQVDADPQLQLLLRQYFEQGQVPPQQPYPGYPPIQPGPFTAPPPAAIPYQPTPMPQLQPQQFTGQPPQPQQPQLPQVPQLTQDDLADPAIAALYQTVQQQNAILAQQQQQWQAVAAQQQTLAQQTSERQMQEQAAILNRVSSSFAQQHQLTPEQLAQVQQVAGRLEVIPSLLKGIDPTTGMPSRPDPLSAVERALEIAYSQIPEFASRREQEVIARFTADQERKRKLSALSGNSGSVPRTTPAPTTAEGRNKALHSEVASMFNGTWSEPQN